MRLRRRVENLEAQWSMESDRIKTLQRKVAFLMCDHCPCQPYDGTNKYRFCCLCHMPVKKEASK